MKTEKTVRIVTLLAIVVLSFQSSLEVANAQQWDFPRLAEIIFKIKHPYTVSLDAAKACEIDVYVGALKKIEVDTLANPPYGWSVTAAPGFHMAYIGINCRDKTPVTSGEFINYHDRTRDMSLYPLNETAFRYALALIVGCNKTVWINEIFDYINVRLDQVVPPAAAYWYNPSIAPYPLDWDQAYAELVSAGFSGTIGGDDWRMPNNQSLREPIYCMSPETAPTTMEITRRHCMAWNSFFCGYGGPPEGSHGYNFVHEPIDFYNEIDIAFYNRDHDMYFLSWSLEFPPSFEFSDFLEYGPQDETPEIGNVKSPSERPPRCTNGGVPYTEGLPTYLYSLFHPAADYPRGIVNSPGLDYRPLNAMLKALYRGKLNEITELRIYGPGPMTISESTKYYTDYPVNVGSENVWIGDVTARGGTPYRVTDLYAGLDYTFVLSGGKAVGINFLRNVFLGPDQYMHIVYGLNTTEPDVPDMQQLCYSIQEMLYYMCPYLPVYSRNYHDLYKQGLESWVPSLGYGSAAYQLKWTYASIHWTGTPVGGTVSWHLGGPVNTLHPWASSSTYEITILARLYDRMLEVSSYTHRGIKFLIENFKQVNWTSPDGENGAELVYWIRNDITWQDGDPVTADDFIWQYEFINSVQPPELQPIWNLYQGCVKYNDYCFSVRVNDTGGFYTLGLMYPKKVWEPFWGNLAAAQDFRPWEVAYKSHVPPEKRGQTQLPTCLYGTGEWIFDYYDTTLQIIRVYKDPNYWMKKAADTSRQVGSMYPPPYSFSRTKTVSLVNQTNALFPNIPLNNTLWLCNSTELSAYGSTWQILKYDNCSGAADYQYDLISLTCLTPQWMKGTSLYGSITVSGYFGNTYRIDFETALPKITKTVLGLSVFNIDTKNNVTCNWQLLVNMSQFASGTLTDYNPLNQTSWWQSLPYQGGAVSTGFNTFQLNMATAYGNSIYTIAAVVLFGDVDNNNIVNMLDLYKVAKVFGQTGPQCWLSEDVDNNGIANMLDLFIIAKLFGTTC